MSREQLVLAAVKRGKYARLYEHLCARADTEWRTNFGELEQILGFPLPNSAQIYRPWWANDSGSGHSQSMAWTIAGWKTGAVDLDAETVVFKKVHEVEGYRPMANLSESMRSTAPSMDEFRSALRAQLLEARTLGQNSVIIAAKDLHRSVGGYPTPFNRMQMCCNAMYEAQQASDHIIARPAKGFGASLTIEYILPR